MEELIQKFLDGYGDGYGNGSGDGDGDGNGNGYGDGDGNGYGYGDGYGNGSGDGYGSGDFLLTLYKGNPVYYVDSISCYFLSIEKHLLFAEVMVININDLSASRQLIFKFKSCFAHGVTLKEAKRDAEGKYYSQLDVEDRIKTFNETFKSAEKYEAALFYEWHSTLTGSCQSGKDLFVKQYGIDLSAKMTTRRFIELTKNSYGGEIIRRLILHNGS